MGRLHEWMPDMSDDELSKMQEMLAGARESGSARRERMLGVEVDTSRIDVPTLVIGAGLDDVIHPTEARRTADLLGADLRVHPRRQPLRPASWAGHLAAGGADVSAGSRSGATRCWRARASSSGYPPGSAEGRYGVAGPGHGRVRGLAAVGAGAIDRRFPADLLAVRDVGDGPGDMSMVQGSASGPALGRASSPIPRTALVHASSRDRSLIQGIRCDATGFHRSHGRNSLV